MFSIRHKGRAILFIKAIIIHSLLAGNIDAKVSPVKIGNISLCTINWLNRANFSSSPEV